jgi:hypothetical protein
VSEGFVPTERIVRAAALNNDFVIPPNENSFPVSASFVVPMDN